MESKRAGQGVAVEDDGLRADPLWYKDAVIYQLHVRSFFDGDDDGVGDFAGLTAKLDYLQELGITAVWLLPFYASPLRDEGYDISDYVKVNPAYGKVAGVRSFIQEAHKRGMHVITELVVNHTSDQHSWFQRARRAPVGSKYRDYYVWSDKPDRYAGARIIFKDTEASNWTWDPIAAAYYWHRFYSHQPDLNFDSPDVRAELLKVVDFWLRLGVDGMRLDAVPYLFEREGTSCENLPETHAFLKKLRDHIDKSFSNRMLLAEANQWPDDAAAYLGDGDECHMAFHFPIMPRLFMALRMEDRYPIIEILDQTPEIPEETQWAMFLRNHDELTLEMVTDEERDYMYRVYARDERARINLGIRRRLAPLLGNARRRIELMNGLLLSLPGTPVIYYGDEIGMGDNIYLGDRDAVRTPMQWTPDRNAGFSRSNPQKLFLPVTLDPEYHFETVNVEAQHANPHSLLWWMRRLIALRRRYKAFGRGVLEFLHPDNGKVLAFLRRNEEESILVVANLSRFMQSVELDLSQFEGSTPIEMFGQNELPKIGELPYFLTLGPHGFYWLFLEPAAVSPFEPSGDLPFPTLRVPKSWEDVLSGKAKEEFERQLARYLATCRWFGGKARSVRAVRIADAIPLRAGKGPAIIQLLSLKVEYRQGEPDVYMLPLAYADWAGAEELLEGAPQAVISRINVADEEGGVLYDGVWHQNFSDLILQLISGRKTFRSVSGELTATPTRAFRRLRGETSDALSASVVQAEQSNTSIVLGDRLIFKLFRRLEQGTNPDLEIGRFLTVRAFQHAPAIAGALELTGKTGPATVGMLQEFIPNEGDAWQYTLGALGRFFETALTRSPDEQSLVPDVPGIDGPVPAEVAELIGSYIPSAELLGRRTAEMHLALAGSDAYPEFAPQPMPDFYRRSLFQSMRSLTIRNLKLLRTQLPKLPDYTRERGEQVADLEEVVVARFRSVINLTDTGHRIRCHGDYHLGQVLYTGKDFVIIDFEGEPARPVGERRLMRSPLQDVAGMLRSFHYATYAAIVQQEERGLNDVQIASLGSWAEWWLKWIGDTYLKGFFEAVAIDTLLPASSESRLTLLNAFVLEKAVYEIGYELNNRPDWVQIPISGVLRAVGPE